MEKDEIEQLKKANEELKKKLDEYKKQLAEKDRKLGIEASLDKIRIRTMTMRNSAELSEASAVLFHELTALRIKAIRTGVGIFDEPNHAMELWTTSASDNKEVLKKLDYFSLYIHPLYENMLTSRKQGKPYSFTKLKGDEVKYYYKSMSSFVAFQQQSFYNEEEYFYSFFFEQGALSVVILHPLTNEECVVMNEFARAFGMMYARFLELQQAENQTREALKKAGLDRIRGEIASMRTANDLERITPLMWRELMTFDVPFSRCGVFIIKEDEELVQAYLSRPEGKSLGVLNLKFGDNTTTSKMIESWRNNTVYKEQWNREQFQHWTASMYAQGRHTISDQYGEEILMDDTLYLHFIPFTQGMLYIGGDEILVEYEIDIIKSLADTFSVAYARYDDFKQLEDAKGRIEVALADLKETQSQLIQSEKMASLGELTAGIAHEIQNPLNFVNNFSDVNQELIQELKVERVKNKEERNELLEDELLRDISQNLEKISHHGKRADAIVKGMLQHSRTTTGKKIPTDINALAGEYLRLSYHGLLAKDNSFAATIKTDFDPLVGQVDIIPQEIGRVLLNLYNNAFYAVAQRSKEEGKSFDPVVSVFSKRANGRVEIIVKDNGKGIPGNIVDKIFQPFFTTKPPGQGTGLGLSLAYDIIKMHAGEMKVVTKENEGTEFIVQL